MLAAPYDPDTKTVQFPAALPASYTDPKQTPQLYLRVWEEQLTGNTTGTPITLTGTGVQVTISLDGPGPVHADDYWCIGVRPSTSTEVYPERYLRTPQPPDGPRQWACPLAVITWLSDQRAVIKDCRHHFRPLPDSSVITQASTGAGPQFRAVRQRLAQHRRRPLGRARRAAAAADRRRRRRPARRGRQQPGHDLPPARAVRAARAHHAASSSTPT